MEEGIFYRCADGAEIPIKEVEGLKGKAALILMTDCMLSQGEMDIISLRIMRRLGGNTNVLLLDSRIKKVMRLEE